MPGVQTRILRKAPCFPRSPWPCCQRFRYVSRSALPLTHPRASADAEVAVPPLMNSVPDAASRRIRSSSRSYPQTIDCALHLGRAMPPLVKIDSRSSIISVFSTCAGCFAHLGPSSRGVCDVPEDPDSDAPSNTDALESVAATRGRSRPQSQSRHLSTGCVQLIAWLIPVRGPSPQAMRPSALITGNCNNLAFIQLFIACLLRTTDCRSSSFVRRPRRDVRNKRVTAAVSHTIFLRGRRRLPRVHGPQRKGGQQHRGLREAILPAHASSPVRQPLATPRGGRRESRWPRDHGVCAWVARTPGPLDRWHLLPDMWLPLVVGA